MSDVGGAAGLILGLNVFMLVEFCCKWFGFLLNNLCIRNRTAFLTNVRSEILGGLSEIANKIKVAVSPGQAGNS